MSFFSAPDFIQKLDSFFAREDVKGAQNYLRETYAELASDENASARLTVLNEIIGLSRQTNEEKEAMCAIDEAVRLIDKCGIEGTKSAGTIYLNCATTLKHFSKAEKSIEYYSKTSEIYDRILDENDPLKAGLYNNMALALQDLEQYEKAEEMFRKAIDITLTDDKNALETAVSYVNLAHLLFGLNPIDEEINILLDKAYDILLNPAYYGYSKYAFTCRKCAPSFGYFGRFLQEKKLGERADEVYGLA